ncbi:MAG: RES domain-containing protein [Lentisphaeria bacterium]|jgi:RES domain-containing protein
MPDGWRLAQPDNAKTTRQMMDGEGAYLYSGRWNSKGTRMAYLGTSLAQAAMELFVNLGRTDVLNTYHKITVSFDESLMTHIDIHDLPSNWSEPSMASSVQAVGDDWVARNTSLVLQVPSAAVIGEYNYLFNPLHPDADQATYSGIAPFTYDPRMLKSK